MKFKVTEGENESPSLSTETGKNAFDVLCSASKTMKLPQKKNKINNIIDATKTKNYIGFRLGTEETTRKQFVTYFCDLI